MSDGLDSFLLATTWRNEKPFVQKVIEQNRGLMAKADKLKNNLKKKQILKN